MFSGLTSTEDVYGFEFRSCFLKNESKPDLSERILFAATPGPQWWAPAIVIVTIVLV